MTRGRSAVMTPSLDPSKVRIHFARRPTPVAGGINDRLPVAVVRPDDDHGVMRGAAADGARPRIIDSMTAGVALDQILRIRLLTVFILVVAHVMIEAHFRIFSGAAMEHRHLIVPRFFIATEDPE